MRRFLPYVGAQMSGSVIAAVIVAAVYWPFIPQFEAAYGLVRGAPGSERAAMIFGQYFPNPAMFWNEVSVRALVTPLHAALVGGVWHGGIGVCGVLIDSTRQ